MLKVAVSSNLESGQESAMVGVVYQLFESALQQQLVIVVGQAVVHLVFAPPDLHVALQRCKA